MKLKEGDRVRMLGPYDGFFTGVPGTVVDISGFPTVFFDEGVDCMIEGLGTDIVSKLHTGGLGLPERCWCIREDLLGLIPAGPQMELFGREDL